MELIYILQDNHNQVITAFESKEKAKEMQKDMLAKNIELTIHKIMLIKQ